MNQKMRRLQNAVAQFPPFELLELSIQIAYKYFIYATPLSLRLILADTILTSITLAIKPVSVSPVFIMMTWATSCCFLIVTYPLIIPKQRKHAPQRAHWL